MNVALGSIFRNSTGYLARFFAQAAALSHLLDKSGHSLRLILAEGDSSDGTWDEIKAGLKAAGIRAFTVIKREHGGPEFGSVEDEMRWRQISFVCDGVLEQVSDDDDALIYVESDLIWEPGMMASLIGALTWQDVDAVAPMCFHRTGFFYDIWGYRRGGARFSTHPPYHPDLELESARGRLIKLDSAGSCIVMRGEVARKCRFDPAEKGIVGFCENLRSQGFTLWLDPSLRVIHP